MKSKNLVDNYAIAASINNVELNCKLASLATKAEIKAEQDKIIKLQAFDSSYFRGKSILKRIPANICWSRRRLEDLFKTCLEDIFNTSSA